MILRISLLFTVLCVINAAETGDTVGGREKIVGCWFTNWAQYRPGVGKYHPSDYKCGLCTHIFYAFEWMNSDFTVKAYDPTDVESWSGGEGQYQLVNDHKNCQPGLKTILSLGGWTFRTTGLFPKVSSSHENRQTFIRSAIPFLRKYNFDGMDLDWEYPSSDTERDDFTLLLQDLRAAFEAEEIPAGKEKLILSVDTSAGDSTIYQAYNIPAVADAVDFINIMTYDYHGNWETGTGINAPLYGREAEKGTKFENWNVNWTAHYYATHGMPKSKINIGMTTYARGWQLTDTSKTGLGAPTSGGSKYLTYSRQTGIATFYEICTMVAESGSKKFWDRESNSSFAVVNNNQWYSYESIESINAKMNWFNKNDFGGVHVWALDLDDFHGSCPDNTANSKFWLIQTINDNLGRIVPVTAPSAMPPMSTTMGINTRAGPTEEPTTERMVTPGAPTTAPPGFCAGRASGFYPDSSSCTTFVLCLGGVDFSMSCPTGLHYRAATKYCDYPAAADCSVSTDAPTGPTIPTVATTTVMAGFTCGANGWYTDPTSCQYFYECVNGVAFHYACPSGTAFNINIKGCDYPKNVPGCT